MAKQIITFGQSPTDRLVIDWMATQGIKPTEVMGYRITRGAHEFPTIELTLVYNEQPTESDKEE